MIEKIQLLPGITLLCFPDSRFKHGSVSIQFVRAMSAQEASLNALLPAVLLRGSRLRTDLRAITLRLDDLYGAAVGTTVRRVGDYQTTGLGCSFIDERFVLAGDRILEPTLGFLCELLLDPATENGIFRDDYVQSEKKNLLAAIDSQLNDKRTYANNRLFDIMCPLDSYGLSRLGTAQQVRAITAQGLWDHYQKVLRESPIQIFYTGSADPRQIAGLLTPLLSRLDRQVQSLPPQSGYRASDPRELTEALEVSQGKLAMGFVSPITLKSPDFVPMQVLNAVLGASMTNKLFMTVREKMSLCYDIGSTFYGSKGILVVSAGLDFDKYQVVRREVCHQLELCVQGQITDEELESARQCMCSQLQAIHDSPGAIESYYGTSALSGQPLTPAQYLQQVQATTREQLMAAAASLKLHSVYFLKGVR